MHVGHMKLNSRLSPIFLHALLRNWEVQFYFNLIHINLAAIAGPWMKQWSRKMLCIGEGTVQVTFCDTKDTCKAGLHV